MKNKKRIRIAKSENILSRLVVLGEKFHIGVPFDQSLLERVDIEKFGLSTKFNNGESRIPLAAGPNTRVNINGKLIRKQPEEKHEIKKHIDYTRKKDNVRVQYDRIFNIYKKELLHQYKIELSYKKDKNGNESIFSESLIFDNSTSSNTKNTHIINVFLEIFKDYEIYREDLDYYIQLEKTFNDELLPSGILSSERDYQDLVSITERHVNPSELKLFTQRLDVFKEFSPVIRQGPKGLMGYLAFVFEDKNLVAAESIKKDNATYFFKMDDYENNVLKDKQDVLSNKLMIKRLFHTDTWEEDVRRFLNAYTK